MTTTAKTSARKIAAALKTTVSITWAHESGQRRTPMIKESTLKPEDASVRDTVDAGDYYLKVIKAGQTLRILDLEGNQAADTLFYSADDPTERYSAMDTIREQGNAYLSAGTRLRSNDNRVMLDIVADT